VKGLLTINKWLKVGEYNAIKAMAEVVGCEVRWRLGERKAWSGGENK
jgi:hypothetical protein